MRTYWWPCVKLSSSTHGFSVRSWNKRTKSVIRDTAERELKFTKIYELASFPPNSLFWVRINPDCPIHMETSCIGFGGIFLGMLDAVDSLVLFEVSFGFDTTGEVEVWGTVLMTATNCGATVWAFRTMQGSTATWKTGSILQFHLAVMEVSYIM